MIFLDTSGVLALAMESDLFHAQAVQMLEAAEAAGEAILVHNYVLVESSALLQRRISDSAAAAFLASASSWETAWVTPELHGQAIAHLALHASNHSSLVDAVSFLVMRAQGITDYIGFDKHFRDTGFAQYGSSDACR